MTPPEAAQGERLDAGALSALPAVSVCPAEAGPSEAGPAVAVPQAPAYIRHGVLNVIAERSDFLKAASARRQGTGSFLLQARERKDGAPLVRIGFTASKKVGNAVIRARAKRRLRALAREVLPRLGQPGWDYVLVARPDATVSNDFVAMRAELEAAFDAVHKARDRSSDRSRERSTGGRP